MKENKAKTCDSTITVSTINRCYSPIKYNNTFSLLKQKQNRVNIARGHHCLVHDSELLEKSAVKNITHTHTHARTTNAYYSDSTARGEIRSNK